MSHAAGVAGRGGDRRQSGRTGASRPSLAQAPVIRRIGSPNARVRAARRRCLPGPPLDTTRRRPGFAPPRPAPPHSSGFSVFSIPLAWAIEQDNDAGGGAAWPKAPLQGPPTLGHSIQPKLQLHRAQCAMHKPLFFFLFFIAARLLLAAGAQPTRWAVHEFATTRAAQQRSSASVGTP